MLEVDCDKITRTLSQTGSPYRNPGDTPLQGYSKIQTRQVVTMLLFMLSKRTSIPRFTLGILLHVKEAREHIGAVSQPVCTGLGLGSTPYGVNNKHLDVCGGEAYDRGTSFEKRGP